MRRWPDGSAYVEAVQNSANIGDIDIQHGSYERRQNGLPKPYSGGFTTTFHFTTPSRDYAVRCFTRGNDDLERRYQGITEFLRFVQHPAFCQAEYLTHGIRVNAAWWPIIKMQWVDGRPLNVEIEMNLHDPAALQRQADSFRKLVSALGILGVAHGDLQHGNLIVANNEFRLIDYDGIYLPALAGMLPSEFGHQNYQHPQRKEAPFDGRLDRFSSIVIYTALKALSHDPGLWRRFNNDENVLFRASDFTSHGGSDLFQVLLGNPNTAGLARQLIAICDASIANVPTLEQVVADAGQPGSQPVYSSFSGSPPRMTGPDLQQQAPPSAPAPSPRPHPVPPSTPTVAPQPFSMPTVRVASNHNVGAGIGNVQAPTGTMSRVAPAFCGNCGAAVAAHSAFCARCGFASAANGQAAVPSPGTRFIGQWNWGAFALYPLWLMNHRRVVLGVVWLVLWFVPVINWIGGVYFGRNGTKIAVLCGRFRDEREFVAVQNAWRNWGLGFIVMAILIALVSKMGSLSTATASRHGPSPTSTRVVAAAPRMRHFAVATGSCESPNHADTSQMEDAIAQFHSNVSQHRWSEAVRYELTATYQSIDSMQVGYAKTIESSPTVTAADKCRVNVTLKYRNNDSSQYCIDQVYDMAYVRTRQPSWVIRDAKSVSDKRLCA